MPAPTPNADALAAQMRILANSPRDVTALVTAADLSTRLADTDAALGFLVRAQAVDPSNPRIIAARANAFVMMERPGEALRLFADAQARGVSMTPYLAQRGLAYDLVGQSAQAQQDYRRSLLSDPDDETTRRLALSLGISGQREPALALLDPLVRRNDRAAWRARACVLALSGDVTAAQTIAASMMAGGAAFAPFFARLPTLSIADRAFAVHFGSMNAPAARMVDARMAPPVTPIVPVRSAPVSVAAATPAPVPIQQRNRRSRGDRRPTDVAAAQPATVATRRPITAAASAPMPALAATPAASVTTAPRVPVTIVDLPRPAQPWTAALAPLSAPPAVAAAAPPPVTSPSPSPLLAPAPIASASATSSPAVTPVRAVSAPARVPGRSPDVARRNTALLASIIETIAVPQSELAAPRTTRTVGTRKPLVVAAAATTKPTAPATKAVAKPETKKADPKKPDPKKADPAKVEPERWWVQVAGGANAGDLGKEWKKLTTKASTALRGRPAWTAPLRATNRLLAGPFKTQGEAMALVNRLRKDDISSFAWQSEAGQKVAKLPVK